MWMKGYLALAAVGSILMIFFVLYALSWTGSIGDPRAALAGYDYHRNYAISTMAAWTVILMVAGNVVLWSTRSAIALWLTLTYFTLSMAAVFVVLTTAALPLIEAIGVADRTGSGGGILLTVIGAIVMGGVILLNQTIVIRIREKMFGTGERERDEKENSRDDDPES